MRVVVTGAAGNIGRKLVDHLRRQGDRFTVLGLDVRAVPPYAERSHDLSVWDEAWVEGFRGADVVAHLAAEGSPHAGWDKIVPHNIDLLLNVYEAARRHGAGRLVFASSGWVLGGYRFEDGTRLTPDIAPKPFGAYGAAKLFAERYGRQLSERTGMSVINLRLGTNLSRVDGHRADAMQFGAWGRMLWLSDRDLCQALEKAITVPAIPYATLAVASRVLGSRWDLAETERVLGYMPEDEWRIEMSRRVRWTDSLARLRDVGGSRLRRLFGRNW